MTAVVPHASDTQQDDADPCHRRGRRITRALTRYLAAPLAALAAAAAVVTITGLTASTAASAATTHNWITTGWNIHLANQAQPATTSSFFNTASSFGTGPGPATDPVSDGFATTPVLAFTSYAKFASDIAHSTIKYPYQWVLYDPEQWSQTPADEQKNPAEYLRMFGQLAHAHGYKVIEIPARDLGSVANSACPPQKGENLDGWYIRCDIAAASAANSDIYIVQDQVNTTTVSEYDTLFNNASAQALAANPSVQVDVELSTHYGTATQMAAAARSVNPSGYYISITTPSLAHADAFFAKMHAAGY